MRALKLQPEADGETQKLQARDRNRREALSEADGEEAVSHRSPRFARQG